MDNLPLFSSECMNRTRSKRVADLQDMWFTSKQSQHDVEMSSRCLQNSPSPCKLVDLHVFISLLGI